MADSKHAQRTSSTETLTPTETTWFHRQIEAHGIVAAADLLHVSVQTVAKLAGGLPISRAMITHARSRRAVLEAQAAGR